MATSAWSLPSHGDEADLVMNQGENFHHAKTSEDEFDFAFAQAARQTPDRQPGGLDIGWSLWATYTRTWWSFFFFFFKSCLTSIYNLSVMTDLEVS